MKQSILLLALLFTGAATLLAQGNQTDRPVAGKHSLPVIAPAKAKHPVDVFNQGGVTPAIPAANDRFFAEAVLGTTIYDLQTNNSMPHRIHHWGDGEISAAWQQAQTAEGSGNADRGTGYNNNFSGSFLPPVTTRVESIRTGFPSYVVAASGEEWILSHVGLTASTYAIHYAHRPKGGPVWTEGNIPTTTSNGGLWARAATGGPDGNTIHVIYLTTPVANSGVAIGGVDGTLRYCRSTDNGASWDKVDIELPGVNSTNFLSISAETYAIDAEGSTVAITVFDWTNDVMMIKSDDNGESWNAPRIVNDFPLTKWDFDDGYTFDDISAVFDPALNPAPNGVTDSLALLTTDETGNVFVDADGTVHVTYGSLFILDPDTTQDGSLNWYPDYDLGIIYWNELMDDNDKVFAGYSPDLNGDALWGSPDNTNPQSFNYDGYAFIGVSTGPTMGMDDDGRLYTTFIANHELNFNLDGFWYKQPFIVRTEMGDWSSWGRPTPVLHESLVDDPTSTAFSENYFAIMAQNVEEEAHVIWQQDFGLGLTTILTGTQLPEINEIRYLAYPTSLMVSGTQEQQQVIRDLSVAPNPATDRARLRFELVQSGELMLEVFNVAGERVMMRQATTAAGPVMLDIQTANLLSGMYFVRLSTAQGAATAKMMVGK